MTNAPRPPMITKSTFAVPTIAITVIALLYFQSQGSLFESSNLSNAKRLVGQQMKDPSSTQYRNIVERNNIVCGEVNAKNSYGAYAGFRRFIVDKDVVQQEPSGDVFSEQYKFVSDFAEKCLGIK